MQELLDDQQTGQEEKPIPKLIYSLASSYVGFWVAMIIVEFAVLDVVFFDWLAMFCWVLNFVLGVGILLTWQQEWGGGLEKYAYGMMGTKIGVLLSIIVGFSWQWGIARKFFEGFLLLSIGATGLFLVAYYQQRQQAAAWWAWLKQGIVWYLVVQVPVLVAVLLELPWLGMPVFKGWQLLLWWLGAGYLLRRAWSQYTLLEGQVARLLFVSLGLFLTLKEIRVGNSTFLELLLLLAIILLLLAIGKAQSTSYNSK